MSVTKNKGVTDELHGPVAHHKLIRPLTNLVDMPSMVLSAPEVTDCISVGEFGIIVDLPCSSVRNGYSLCLVNGDCVIFRLKVYAEKTLFLKESPIPLLHSD